MSAGVKANADGSAAIQVGGSDAIQISAALNTTLVGSLTSAGAVTGTNLFGQGQTWQSFTVGTQRISGTTYTNSTGRPISVAAYGGAGGANSTLSLVIDGFTIQAPNGAAGVTTSVTGIVPAGSTYSVTISAGTINGWRELR